MRRLALVDGWAQVLKVNKSPATKRVTSVAVLGTDPYLNDNEPKPRTLKVERLGEDAYRPPTVDEREYFRGTQAKAKAAKKAKSKANPAPKLLNPTDADAERLQALWNARAKARHDAGNHYKEFEPNSVLRMTQAQYSANSKGAYASFEAVAIVADGRKKPRSDMWTAERAAMPEVICKVRLRYSQVIVLTDKPRKPLPLDWKAIENPAEAKPETAQPAGTLF